MQKIFLLLILSSVSFSTFAQDTLGIPFDFKMKKGKVYSYYFITQEYTKNVNDHIDLQFVDSARVDITVDLVNKFGYGLTFNFKPYNKSKSLPDAIYKIPLRVALDTNGNVLGMVNHGDYRNYLFNQIDSAYAAGEYDSATYKQMKYLYNGTAAIENLVFVNVKEFFSLFGKKLQPMVKYYVGKDLINPFSMDLFPAGGVTTVLPANPILEIYYVNTSIANTQEERKLLSATYQDYLIKRGQFNPNIITPAVDLSYESKFLFNYKTKLIEEFRVFDVIRLGDERKERTTVMTLIK